MGSDCYDRGVRPAAVQEMDFVRTEERPKLETPRILLINSKLIHWSINARLFDQYRINAPIDQLDS
jgi:hypothetical protein